MTDARSLFSELWRFYELELSAEGISPLAFAELVTYLLFLKIDDERSNRHLNPVQVVPDGLGWSSLNGKSAKALDQQFRHVLQECGKQSSDPATHTRRVVFRDAATPLPKPAKLESLIKDVFSRTWRTEPRDSLRGMYALLMAKASADFQIEAGQTLTPLPFVQAVVDCMGLTQSDTMLDPACGTGSFLVAAYQAMAAGGRRLAPGAVTGLDLDVRMGRLATMNYLLSTGLPFNIPPPVAVENSLAEPYTGKPPGVIICNPPFRSTAPSPKGRTDLVAATGSIQLNFLQHIARALPVGGRAAVFVPDNILFLGGASQAVREWLFQHCIVHTLIRLPSGVFSRGLVKTNVLFFDRVAARSDGKPMTEQIWIYDLRTGKHYSAKRNPLSLSDLDDFVTNYGSGKPKSERTVTDRFKPVAYADLHARHLNLDYTWPGSGASPETLSPKQIAGEIMQNLSAAVAEFAELADVLPGEAAAGLGTESGD